MIHQLRHNLMYDVVKEGNVSDVDELLRTDTRTRMSKHSISRQTYTEHLPMMQCHVA